MLFGREEPRQDRGGLFIIARLSFQLLPAPARQSIELGLAIIFRDAPFSGDVPLLLELEQGRVESAVVDRQMIGAGLFDAARDAIAVQRPQRIERLQDHQGKRPLPHISPAALQSRAPVPPSPSPPVPQSPSPPVPQSL